MIRVLFVLIGNDGGRRRSGGWLRALIRAAEFHTDLAESEGKVFRGGETTPEKWPGDPRAEGRVTRGERNRRPAGREKIRGGKTAKCGREACG